MRCGAEARDFSGQIRDFGQLEANQQKTIRKGLKVMCREIQMGVAAAQRALQDAGLKANGYDCDRTGCVYGSDYIMTLPDEFTEGIRNCVDEEGFHFSRWAEHGLPKVAPLWLLKYLPNMPASHIAIYNDLRGPNNSITLREASPTWLWPRRSARSPATVPTPLSWVPPVRESIRFVRCTWHCRSNCARGRRACPAVPAV